LRLIFVANELKKKRAEIGVKVEELRALMLVLEQRQAVFEVVIRMPGYSPAAAPTAG